MVADFFALLRSGEPRRLVLEGQLQQSLHDRFSDGARRLTADQLEHVEFESPTYTPDESEVFSIAPFQLPEVLTSALDNAIGCPPLSASEIEGDGIKAIVASSFPAQSREVAFQVRNRSDLLSAKGASLSLILDRDTYKRLKNPGLLVGDEVHVVVRGEELLFRSPYWARRVFDLSTYYREATESDVLQFAARDDIGVGDPAEFAAARSNRDRQRIASILDSGVLDNLAMDQIGNRADELGVKVRIDEGRLIMPESSSELKTLLQFLEERIYRGPLTESPFLASSRRRR